MADETPAPARCEQCGQTDDHPKVHFLFGRTVHYDCMSAQERDDYGQAGGSYGPDPDGILEARESGKRGEELRDHIRAAMEAEAK